MKPMHFAKSFTRQSFSIVYMEEGLYVGLFMLLFFIEKEN